MSEEKTVKVGKGDKVGTPYMTVPNQRTVVTDKNLKAPFLQVNYEDIRQAARDLTLNGLKLYLYMCENKDKFTYGFSTKDWSENYGVRASSITDAWKQLVDKGYLTLQDGCRSKFVFHSSPIKPKTAEELMEELKRNSQERYFPQLGRKASYQEVLTSFGGDESKTAAVWEMGEDIKEENE